MEYPPGGHDLPAVAVTPDKGPSGFDTTLTRSVGSDDATLAGRETDSLPMRGHGRYELLSEQGRGGVGRVWRARDLELGREVALKETIDGDDHAHPRFVREVLATARLEHPGIVPIYEAGCWPDGRPFYVMRLIAGHTLADAARTDRTLHERIARLPNVIAVADAVAYAHARRVVHRDLKPSNVLVGEFGETVVIDWGLAKALAPIAPGAPPSGGAAAAPDREAAGALADDGAAPPTRTGTLVGTPAFMAPEQASGGAVDERTDVFAIGALLYFVLSGKKPYDGPSVADTLARARTGAFAALGTVEPRVPADLAAIVAKAMAVTPGDRYPSARELAADLKRFQAGHLVAAHAYSIGQRIERWVRRNRALAIAVAVFVAVGLVGVTAFARREQTLRKAAEDALVRADESTLALLEQQGRTELAAGRPLQAVAYLVEAYRRRPASRVLAALAAQAIRPLARLSRTYVGHAHDIPYVAFSPDGDRFVTASTDGTSRIWQTQSGTLLGTLSGHDRLVDAATFSPDGQRVVVAGDRVRVFTTGGTPVWSADIPGTWRVWYSPDGKRVFAGTQTGRLVVLDAATGALLADASEHHDRIESLAFTGDGARFAVASWDNTVTLWDAASVKVTHRLADHDHPVTSAAWSADGHYLASADMEGEIQLRRGDTGERIRFIRLPSSAHAVHLWFDRDGQTLLVTGQDGSVRRVHLGSGVVLDEFDCRAFGKLMATALSPDGHTMVTTGVAGRITVWDLGAGTAVRVLPHPIDERAEIDFSELTHDKQRFVTVSDDGMIRVWDAATGAILHQVVVPHAERIAIGGDARRVLVGTTTRAAPAFLIDATTGATIASFEADHRLVSGVASSRDGRAFALALYDGSVRVLDAATGAETAHIAVDTGRLSAVTFDPEGNPVAAGESGKVWILDRATATVKRSFAAHTTWIQDIEYSADGKRLVTAGRQDHTVKVWDAATDTLQLTLSGHKNNVMRASFSPDGAWIATTGVDNTALVWDAASGELAWSFLGPAYTAEWSADSKQLFTTGIDGFIAVFTLGEDRRPPGALAAELTARSPWALVDGRLQPR